VGGMMGEGWIAGDHGRADRGINFRITSTLNQIFLQYGPSEQGVTTPTFGAGREVRPHQSL